MWTFFHKLTSPPHYYRMAPGFILGFGLVGGALVLWGTYSGLFLAPIDYQQKDAFRIIYVHVPASYLSMLAYVIMAISAGIGLIWRMRMAHSVAAAAAPLGAWFTFVALATGSIWGRPMWGTWWEWGDPRLTSELLMLFLYFGYIALRSAIDDIAKADKASAVLALVGGINIPIIHYSVTWWTSLHQGETVMKGKMAAEMLNPLLINILGFTLLFGALILYRVRTEVLLREHRKRWVKSMLVPDTGEA